MLKSDFENDWKKQMVTELTALKVPIDASLPIDDIAIAYQNVRLQSIPITPRQIEKSDVFACPKSLLSGLAGLEHKIVAGGDLNPHRSRGTGKLGNDDDLLSDWGVFHLHLGTVLEADGFIKRTGPVLFALPTNTHIYMIQVYDHGEWANKDVLEIIHRNWPQIISNYKLQGVVDVAVDYGSSEIAKMRKHHGNTILKVSDGTIYSPPGGGMATSGKSVTAVRQAMNSISDVKKWDKFISSQPAEIVNDLVALGYDKKSDVHFSLEMNQKGVYAFAKAYSYSEFLVKFE